MLRWLVQTLLSIILKLFFHKVDAFGESRVPKEGPLVFVCAPHANQFLDPIVVTANCNRRVGFLAAQKSIDRKYVGALIKALGSIGVKRPQDYMKKATGTVITQGTKVIGVNTQFTKEFGNKAAMYFSSKKDIAEIAEIISDTECVIKAPFHTDVGEPTSIKVVPHIDQNEVYDVVFAELKSGGCIGIFPEGGSHDQPSMLPLKAGVTIMALGAMAKYPEINVRVVPVGLNYFQGHKFRSLAFADFGDPITIPAELVAKYKDKATKREACATLLDMIHRGLQAVTVNVKDYDLMRVMQLTRRLYNPGVKLTVAQKLELMRRFTKGYELFKDDPRVQKLIADVIAYDHLLQQFHLKDSQVEVAERIGWCRSFWLLLWRILKLVTGLACALPGAILYGPVALIASHYSKAKAVEAKASSNVKLYGRDVLATWKVMVGMVLFPLFTLGYAIVAAIVLSFVGAESIYEKIFIPIGTFFLLPFLGYIAVRFGETAIITWRSFRSLRLALCPWSECSRGHKSLWDVKEARRQLQIDVSDLVEALGPQAISGGDRAKFESERVISGQKVEEHVRAISPRGSRPPADSQHLLHGSASSGNMSVASAASSGSDEVDDNLGVGHPDDEETEEPRPLGTVPTSRSFPEFDSKEP